MPADAVSVLREDQKLGWLRSGPGPVAQPVFKTGEAA